MQKKICENKKEAGAVIYLLGEDAEGACAGREFKTTRRRRKVEEKIFTERLRRPHCDDAARAELPTRTNMAASAARAKA
jgi:hypothetical protein